MQPINFFRWLQRAAGVLFLARGSRRRGGQSGSVGKFNLPKMAWIVFVFCAAIAIASPAQTYTVLVNFNGPAGLNPWAALVQGTDGNLYGTAFYGGSFTDCGYGLGCGTVFNMTPGGTLLWSFSFCGEPDCLDSGSQPYAGLVQGTDGNFYGTTSAWQTGTAPNYGSVFAVTPTTFTLLHTFDLTDGAYPLGGLVQDADGNFYGTTSSGGANGGGTVFKITPAGVLTTLWSFCTPQGYPNCPDGLLPYGGLVLGTDGNFYGTTAYGGNADCVLLDGYPGCGTVFKITPGGVLTTLHSFVGTDGAWPYAGLLQAADGNFYGTTSDGGTYNGEGVGTVFEITPGGALTTLHTFAGTDGGSPYAGLIQATDGNFYGTTFRGGASGSGTVFQLTPPPAGSPPGTLGTLTTLYNFAPQGLFENGIIYPGENPAAALVQDTNGTFYGTTVNGGAYYEGVVFSLSMGLGPFVETQPTSGNAGAAVIILGTNLAGATSVSFNGTAATFTVVSSSEITTTVPAGATTGSVTVVTPSGTLNSNKNFIVGSAPAVMLSTTGLNFGSVGEGTPSAPQSVTVTNTGKANLNFGTVALSGTNAADFTITSDACSNQTVTPTNTCSVGVSFIPSLDLAEAASLNFPDNASNSPQTVTLSGSGAPPFVKVVLAPVNPYTITAATGAYNVTLTLTNGGNVVINELTLLKGTLGGLGAVTFPAGTTLSNLSPGASATFTATFSSAAGAAGNGVPLSFSGTYAAGLITGNWTVSFRSVTLP